MPERRFGKEGLRGRVHVAVTHEGSEQEARELSADQTLEAVGGRLLQLHAGVDRGAVLVEQRHSTGLLRLEGVHDPSIGTPGP
jgi:hypothetical protein